ncbi:hypothetical protein AYL99_05591 [Fonsecaea erecta]|uniref:Uncharacterized protein n=1 Tax=Fonsecaea erecta TaxID=1367422 RepID=A0A178ZLC0_9EURO|nr:hypothetical protein AYL99_05591 [Fonsecaea erecta]OAP60589.1 hypothetical protein AYL99_05591 [Fonsecaea erecta]
MQTRAVQVILLICSLILAIIILIASSKYGAWSHEMVPGPSKWLPLVFYVGTIPFFSLLYTVSHLAALQFNGLPSPPYPNGRSSKLWSARQSTSSAPYDAHYTVTTTFFILCVSILHTLMWFAQSVLCTSCELAPILAGHQGQVPAWCPQSRFHDTGKTGLAGMLGTLATVKDLLQWVMFVLAAVLVECARREWMRAEHVRSQQVRLMGAGVDFGGGARAADGFDSDFSKKPIGGGGRGVELTNISGPRLVFRAEEEAAAAAAAAEAAAKQQQRAREQERGQGESRRHDKPLPPPQRPQPTVLPSSKKKDNYYGNGMALQRSGTVTLNHMYESRV